MSASSQERILRMQAIEQLLPSDRQGKVQGLSVAQIEARLANAPGMKVLSRRSLQRDLKEMAEEGRVCVLESKDGTPRYQRIEEPLEFDAEVWDYLVLQLKQELSGMVSASQLSQVLRKLQLRDDGTALDEHKLRILPDSLRLQPAQFSFDVLGCVLRALASGKALKVTYRDRTDKVTTPVLHPLGMIQRGPRIYLYAMKNDEHGDRMYAVDRICSAECLPIAARSNPDFDLGLHIEQGRADFANGEMIQLKLEVRGYIEQLVYDCPLNGSQQLTALEERDGSLLTVEIPSSGQLLRWILAGGENVTVLEPAKLREVVVEQVARMRNVYCGTPLTTTVTLAGGIKSEDTAEIVEIDRL
ncbi:hypothetical protein THUN1379_24740 [Paludibacterium sp. THUN1379]|uniref:helix-turn-helix transcriptional regulator n=1 Tax=Paludibacterium sp. THUN1379 TaxID=3112107 RepID=UPI003087257C|nr:hypothetical protein THUN1379_24740 [Paludibacterium sp. THUN1379]